MVVPPLVSWGCGVGQARRAGVAARRPRRGRRRGRGWDSPGSDGRGCSALMAVLPSCVVCGTVGGAVGVVGLGQLQPVRVVAKLGDLLGELALPVDSCEVERFGLLA